MTVVTAVGEPLSSQLVSHAFTRNVPARVYVWVIVALAESSLLLPSPKSHRIHDVIREVILNVTLAPTVGRVGVQVMDWAWRTRAAPAKRKKTKNPTLTLLNMVPSTKTKWVEDLYLNFKREALE